MALTVKKPAPTQSITPIQSNIIKVIPEANELVCVKRDLNHCGKSCAVMC